MQEEFDRIIADLNRYSHLQRQTAMLGMFADFVRFGGQKAAELEEAGYHQQAVELRRRLAEMMPDAQELPPPALPAAPVLPAARSNVPAVNGVINGAASGPLSPQPRRGRPPKNPNGGGTQS